MNDSEVVTIKMALVAKREAEAAIMRCVRMYENLSCCRVTQINATQERVVSERVPRLTSIIIESEMAE